MRSPILTVSPDLPRPVRAVLFDMDGTLLDTEAVHRLAMQEAARTLGHAMPDALFLAMVGVHRDRNIVQLRDHFGDDFPVDPFYDEADAQFETLWQQRTPLRPGARAALERLAGLGLPLAICTSTVSPLAEQRLVEAGLADFFTVVVTRSDVERPKPDAEPYLLAAARLGLAASDCVAVEDSPNGLRAAAAAGTMALLVPDLIDATDDIAALAHAVLPDLASVAALIDRDRQSA